MCACAIIVVHEHSKCLEMQRHTHITLYDQITIYLSPYSVHLCRLLKNIGAYLWFRSLADCIGLCHHLLAYCKYVYTYIQFYVHLFYLLWH